MSYSFFVVAATAAAAVELAAVELERVVTAQPIHAVDRAAALAACAAYTEALSEPEPEAGMELALNVSGSLSYYGPLTEGGEPCITGASVSVSASWRKKQT